jgi:hypothetical protein
VCALIIDDVQGSGNEMATKSAPSREELGAS